MRHLLGTKKTFLPWLALFFIMSFYCLDYYFRIVPSLIVPELMQQYQINSLGVGAFASAFYLGYLLFQLPIGVLLERINLFLLFSLMIAVCCSCFILFLYATVYWQGLILRFIIGASSAFSFIGILYFARFYLPLKYFSLICGLTIGLGTLAASLTQFISAYLFAYFAWQSTLAVLTLGGFLLALFIFILFCYLKMPPDSKSLQSKISWQQIKTLLRHPPFILNAIIGGLFYVPTSLFSAVWGIIFLEKSYHVSRDQASFCIILLFLAWAIGAPFFGWIARFCKKITMILIITSILAAAVSFYLLKAQTTSFLLACTLVFIFGLLSSSQALVWKIFESHCPAEVSGTGIAVANSLIMISSTLFQLLAGYLILDKNNSQSLANIEQGLMIMPVLFLLTCFLAVFLQYYEKKLI